MAKPKSTSFAHLAGQSARAASLAQHMTRTYHRAAGARAARAAEDSDLEEAAKPEEEREPSEADQLVEKMKRSYNRSLGRPDDDRHGGEEGDGKPRKDNREEASSGARRQSARGTRALRGAR